MDNLNPKEFFEHTIVLSKKCMVCGGCQDIKRLLIILNLSLSRPKVLNTHIPLKEVFLCPKCSSAVQLSEAFQKVSPKITFCLSVQLKEIVASKKNTKKEKKMMVQKNKMDQQKLQTINDSISHYEEQIDDQIQPESVKWWSKYLNTSNDESESESEGELESESEIEKKQKKQKKQKKKTKKTKKKKPHNTHLKSATNTLENNKTITNLDGDGNLNNFSLPNLNTSIPIYKNTPISFDFDRMVFRNISRKRKTHLDYSTKNKLNSGSKLRLIVKHKTIEMLISETESSRSIRKQIKQVRK